MSDQKITSEHRTSRRNPCRVCESTSWCCNFEDRTLCMKIASDRPAKDEGWWHPLPGCEWPEYRREEMAEKPERPAPTERAGLARRNQVYTDLLGYLSLSKAHAEHLQGPKRQLNRTQIDLRQYRTLWNYDGDKKTQELYAFKIAGELQDQHGDLHKVPGFGNREQFSNKPGDRIAGALCLTPRIMIPVRSVEGMIEGFQLMDPEPADEDTPKYVWFSGVGEDGAGVGKPLHVSRPVCTRHSPEKNVDIVITEGPLKADIVSDQVGITTVAFQGVKCIDWQALASTIEALEPRRILLALDADRHRNEHVAKAHEELCRWCEEHGHAYMVADWSEEGGKGLDDLLLSGGKPTWLEPRPKEAPPEKRERIEIERLAISSSWSQPATARELTEFPDSAWESKLHRACVQAIRRLLAAREDLNPRSIRRMIKAHEPQLLPQWKDLEAWYVQNQKGLRKLQRSVVRELREEIDWDNMGDLLDMARERYRVGEYQGYYEFVHRALTGLVPGSSQEQGYECFEKVFLRRIEQHLSSDGPPETIVPTGIKAVDDVMGGIQQGHKVLLVGRPGSGKTALAFQFATNASPLGFLTLFLSLEMRKRRIADRAISTSIQKNLKAFKKADYEAAKLLASHYRNIYIDDRPCKVTELETRIGAFVYRHPQTAFIFTDFAGKLRERTGRGNSSESAAMVADAWADSSDRHDVAHILLKQPIKNCGDIPELGDIKDAAEFEQLADVIMWFHRPHQVKRSIDPRYAEIHFLKFRDGETRVVPVKFNGATYSVSEWVGPTPFESADKKSKKRTKKTAEKPAKEIEGQAELEEAGEYIPA